MFAATAKMMRNRAVEDTDLTVAMTFSLFACDSSSKLCCPFYRVLNGVGMQCMIHLQFTLLIDTTEFHTGA